MYIFTLKRCQESSETKETIYRLIRIQYIHRYYFIRGVAENTPSVRSFSLFTMNRNSFTWSDNDLSRRPRGVVAPDRRPRRARL